MLDAPFAFAFAAGAVAAFNPCGFALLPAYLASFIGLDPTATERPLADRLGYAAVVAGSVSSGFVAVFGVAGLLISQASVAVAGITPWISVVIGLALVPFGIATTRGWELPIHLPRPGRSAGGRRDLAAMAWFGCCYAIVSLSCTIPAFLVAVVSTFEEADAISGLVVFGAYSAGMAAVLSTVTLAMAITQEGLVRRLRSVLPRVQQASGVLLVAAGVYVAYYGWYELSLERGGNPPNGPVDLVGRWSGSATRFVDGLGVWAIAAVGAAVAGVSVLAVSRRRASEPPA